MARSIAAQTATAIRRELKTAFPLTKFRVTSDNFSGGNAVRINWVDGPTYDEVSRLTVKYEYGRFDGMWDLYEYTNVRDDIPQVKYVTHHRQMSDRARRHCEARTHGQDTDAAHRLFWGMSMAHVPTSDADWAWLTRY
jgi:hypothetical protein